MNAMSQEDTVKKLVTFKEKLEKRIKKLESKLNEERLMLETINSILLEKGFKHANITGTPTAASIAQPKSKLKPASNLQPSNEHEDVIPLKTIAGELLANLYTNQNALHVIPAKNKSFNINTPPFKQFLVGRVLEKMHEKDSELADTGKLNEDQIFSYNIIQENDTIREIVIESFNADRLRELKSSIRWTLEKMHEKIENQT